MMGLQKKKNVIIVTFCMILCFILYQLYFFLAISSVSNNNEIVPINDYQVIQKLKQMPLKSSSVIRSESDKFLNNNGIIRGVLQINLSKYRPNSVNEFKCLKTEQRIPFEYVNDDYCDCEDGTDEPSTTACVNGTFYCDTQFGKGSTKFFSVPSGLVNDGICDCCDGSDEWLQDTLLSQVNDLKLKRVFVKKCFNICK